MSPRSIASLLLGLFAVSTLACGKQGAPMPPPRYVPATTDDLAVQQRGTEVTLTLSHPKTTVGGSALSGLEAVELWQVSQPATGEGEIPEIDARIFEATAVLALRISGAELTGALSGDRIVLRHQLAQDDEPTGYTFAVRTEAVSGERSDLSNRVSLVPASPPPPPGIMIVLAEADGIRVHWESEESELEGYHVYRRDARTRQYGSPLERVDAETREYLDTSAVYGERYIYALRAVATVSPLVESATAVEREINYRDTFAPSTPPDLLALPEEGRMRLRWRASPEADVVGYFLYRADPEADFRRLNETPLRTLEYIDTGLVAGLVYRYQILAVDGEGNESESSAPIEARAR